MAKKVVKKQTKPVKGINRPAHVPLGIVIDALRVIHDNGDSDHFMEAATKAGAVVTVHPKTLKFVKEYLENNQLHTFESTRRVIVCKHPYDCDNVHKD